MTSYFRIFATFKDPKKCCRNCVDSGKKRAKTCKMMSLAKNGGRLRSNIAPITRLLTLRFECQMSKGVISLIVKRIVFLIFDQVICSQKRSKNKSHLPKLFMDAQEYEVYQNILYHDDKIILLIELYIKRSFGKSTIELNIYYFFLTYLTERGNVSIKYLLTNEMMVDYMPKTYEISKFNHQE